MDEDEAKLTIRMSRTLLDRLRREAEKDGRSLNAWIVRVLSPIGDLPEAQRQNAVTVPASLDAYGPVPGGVGKVTQETIPATDAEKVTE